MGKPTELREKIDAIVKANGLNFKTTPLILVGIRGCFLDSIGVPGKNDRGVFDDAFFWITEKSFLPFNGNTDPTRVRKGKGTGSSKGMASLKCGLWWYKTGIHNGSFVHPAFRQAADVVVIRDGIDRDYEEKGQFGINIHRASPSGSTSSLGCQTVPVAQWPAFKDHGYNMVKLFKLSKFPYLLVDEIQVRKGNYKVV